MQKILVTGANGFVGKHLCRALLNKNYSIRAAVRTEEAKQELSEFEHCECCVIGDINAHTHWHDALKDVDVVIHLAARVHVMKDNASDPLAEFRSVNVFGTEKLAKTAIQTGVKNFIYLSSIKVNGEFTKEKPFLENDKPNPQDPYGISKSEAEQVLNKTEGMSVSILRPPLIYGPGVGANFLKLMQMIKKGLPLPLASVKNKRSLIYVGNLVDAIITCLTPSTIDKQTFLIRDGEDLSTPDLIKKIANALKVSPRLFPMPATLLKYLAKATGKTNIAERLLGSLQIDNAKIREKLRWHPPYSVDKGLETTMKWYNGIKI